MEGKRDGKRRREEERERAVRRRGKWCITSRWKQRRHEKLAYTSRRAKQKENTKCTRPHSWREVEEEGEHTPTKGEGGEGGGRAAGCGEHMHACMGKHLSRLASSSPAPGAMRSAKPVGTFPRCTRLCCCPFCIIGTHTHTHVAAAVKSSAPAGAFGLLHHHRQPHQKEVRTRKARKAPAMHTHTHTCAHIVAHRSRKLDTCASTRCGERLALCAACSPSSAGCSPASRTSCPGPSRSPPHARTAQKARRKSAAALSRCSPS